MLNKIQKPNKDNNPDIHHMQKDQHQSHFCLQKQAKHFYSHSWRSP